MTDLVVRRLLIDLNTPFPGRWNGGDAFRSAFFSALSMSFPVGEQYFMDSVRAGLQTLPPAEREQAKTRVAAYAATKFQGMALTTAVTDDHRVIRLHRVPIDELLILAGVGRARRGQEVDRLQQIRLALGVIAM